MGHTPKGHKRSAIGQALERKTTMVYEKSGWTVLHDGWPDLLCVRQRFDGTFEAQLVECKANGGPLRANQKRMHKMLKELGLNVIVESGDFNGRPWVTSKER
jgi:VRR-NUC domain